MAKTEQLKFSDAEAGAVKWGNNPFGKQFTFIHPTNPHIPLLGVYARDVKTYVYKKTCAKYSQELYA